MQIQGFKMSHKKLEQTRRSMTDILIGEMAEIQISRHTGKDSEIGQSAMVIRTPNLYLEEAIKRDCLLEASLEASKVTS